ncbi:MAG TPA: hypothetical protein VF395_12010, partial [Polyangiaceae bacterium]
LRGTPAARGGERQRCDDQVRSPTTTEQDPHEPGPNHTRRHDATRLENTRADEERNKLADSVYSRAVLVVVRAVAVSLVLTDVLAGPHAHAQSIADAVRNHVDQGLEKPKPPPPRKSAPGRAPPPPPRRNAARPPTFQSLPPEPPPEPEPAGPEIPQRIIGKNLRIDPKFGGGVRGWIPAQYPTVHTSAGTYFTWSIEANAKIFRLLNIHRGYYESDGLSAPRHEGAAVQTASNVLGRTKQAAWLLGMVGFPITKAWEPIIRYETRAFRTTATPKQPVRIVPFDTAPDTQLSTIAATTNALSMVSGFETLVLGVRYDQSEDHSATIDSKSGPFPPFYFGVGFTQYSKPYQVTVGDSVLDSVLFDARFRGAGLALGATLPGGPKNLILDGSAQIGLGEVRLLDRLTLNELLPQTPGREGLTPPEWLIGYVEGDVSVGYMYPLLKTAPSVLVSLVANGGGATFFYFKTQTEQGEKVSTPPLNWDFLWGVRGYVTVPL